MKLERKEGYIRVIAPGFVRWVGKLMTDRTDARAVAIFPFIIFREESQVQLWVVNHERIHFRQQFDTFFIGLPLITLFEQLYARFVLKKSRTDSYLYTAADQEAYRNQQNPEYLKHRRFGAFYQYLFNKRNFAFGEPGEIKYLD